MAHPLSVRHTMEIEKWTTEKGEAILTAVILLKETVKHKKSVSTKMYNQTNKQPTKTICSNLKDELFLGALCSFCDFWCHNVFLCICFSLLFFPFLDLFLLWASQAWLCGSRQPTEGRKNSLAMYKKEQVKPKMLFLMSFLYCSLVSFFVTVIIWRFPNCTKLHGN